MANSDGSCAGVRAALLSGLVIPASPLALNSNRKLDERRQRALWRYYSAAGSGGIAVGVHTTQFGIRRPEIGLFDPILRLGCEEFDRLDTFRAMPLVRIAGICGPTRQAVGEAELAASLGYHAGLLSLGALRDSNEDEVVSHCAVIAETLPIVGFYLQPSVGGRLLSYRFWRRLMEIEKLVAVKIAPFNRYQTIDVMRAAAESNRDNVALYTGNDDTILLDLITPYRFQVDSGVYKTVQIVGGLLGHWSVWTRRAAALLEDCKRIRTGAEPVTVDTLRLSAEITDSNAAFFDAAHGFAGCIAGLHEVLRRQGLLEGIWCLDPDETLSSGQKEEIDRVYAAYPHLNDDAFVRAHLDEWLSG